MVKELIKRTSFSLVQISCFHVGVTMMKILVNYKGKVALEIRCYGNWKNQFF